jgi:glycerophosphoryl diester phosphodiesterase
MAFEIQAHRGARSFYPENTIQAFCKAADLGVRVLELDLVVSKDHEIVVSHDPWLSAPHSTPPDEAPPEKRDACGSLIYDMAYSDIAQFDCGLPDPAFPGQQRISACKPLLSQVFSAVDEHMASAGMKGRMIFNLELKSWPDKDRVFHPDPEQYAALVLSLVNSFGNSAQVRLQSFDYRVVRAAWKLERNLCYGLLIEEKERIEPCLNELGFLPHYVNPHFSLVDRRLSDYLHCRKIGMIPWTVNSPEDMLSMKRCGADGIITDYPEVALSFPALQD